MEAAVAYQTDYETERGKPMPSLNHGAVQAYLLFELIATYRKKFRFVSETALDISDWRSVPDISILPLRKLDFRNDEIRVHQPPLGIIEILSPTQFLDDLTDKAAEYFEHGVKSCWLVLPTLRNIYVFSDAENYRIFRHSEQLVDEVLGIEIPLNEVFS